MNRNDVRPRYAGPKDDFVFLGVFLCFWFFCCCCFSRAVIDATKIIEDYRRFFASFWPGIFRISANNFPLLSLCSSLLVEMTKIPEIPELFHYFFGWNLRNLPTEPTSEMLASFAVRAPARFFLGSQFCRPTTPKRGIPALPVEFFSRLHLGLFGG